MKFRGTIAAWHELLPHLDLHQPFAATTAELDATWHDQCLSGIVRGVPEFGIPTMYAFQKERPKEPPVIFGTPVVELDAWPEWLAP